MRKARGLRTHQAVAVAAQARTDEQTFDAPIGGWVTNTQLSRPVPRSARRLDNYYCTSTGVRPRGGMTEYADLASANPVDLFTYAAGVTQRMFAGIDGSIWDISGAPSEEVTGQTADVYSAHQFDTGSGGANYLNVVNGADLMQLYDGATWQTGGVGPATAPIAITGIETYKFSFGWAYRNRNYYIERNSLTVWFLPLNQVGGAATDYTLSGIFKKGSSLLFGGTWSVDAGDGADARWFVVTREGELAVFEGADPDSGASDPDPWRIVGVYAITDPLGAKATMEAGGDVLIATKDGLVPLSQVLVKDPAALSLAAVSRNIEPDWKREAAARTTMPWSILKWPEENKMLIGLPQVNAQTTEILFVANLETGAWSRYVGFNCRSLARHAGNAFMGTDDGRVMQLEDGGSDDGAIYVCKLAGQWDHLKRRAARKSVKVSRAVFQSSRPIDPQISYSVNYAESFPSPPGAAADTSEDVWDEGLWDTARWDSTREAVVHNTRWTSTPAEGYVHAPQIQITCGQELRPDAELIQIDCVFEPMATVI